MKKIIGLAIGMVAMVALSGCNTTGGPGNPGADGTTNVQKVDVEDLELGYVVDGYDSHDKDISLYFCGNKFDFEREPSDSFAGTFNIESDLDVLFLQTDPNAGSYRLYTSVDNGYIIKGNTYDLESTYSHTFTVTNISVDDTYANYACR